ncbi:MULTISPECIES: Dabb family protein [Methylomonas]|uniref:Stress protein n=2 Tax=Methylomonas TaxID=416 RepID=A0A140E4D1_9GAMM|nr:MULTISPECIES: Dabb family protein [Methylomonas]AMK75255.1 stress protein [Methylomonas denitrificans]OAH99352.1 stress protein [Methylomonas methanica]TCV84997.1 stress responsive alpha/beta barrel protein [Methylomonas methanica]
MKRLYPVALAGLLAASGTGCSYHAKAEHNLRSHKVHHVVIVWLKQAGDEKLRQQYIQESEGLAKLPGVLAYDVGTPAAINRGRPNAALDESYDVAVSGVYESQQAYEAFLRSPEYLRVAQQVLRPLVDKYKVYDFIE